MLYNPAAEIVLPKRPPRLPTESFTVSEVEQILATPDITTPLGLRDRAILETLYSTGMRRIEMVNLDLYDLDRDRGWVTVRQGKGGKDRVVPIGEAALRWVEKYLEAARGELVVSADEWAVFISNRGRRFNPGAMTNLVSRLLDRAGVRKRYGLVSSLSAHDGDSDARGRCRHPGHPGDPGTCESRDDRDLHEGLDPSLEEDPRGDAPVGETA